jgi:hypothetical protein
MSGGSVAGGAQVGLGAFQMIEARNQADAIKRQAEFQARQAEFNAQLVGLRAEDLKAQSFEDITERQNQARQIIGAQKTALAAQGIEVDSELGLELQKQEELYAQQDVNTIKNNVWRQALGMEVEKNTLRSQAGFTRLAGESSARSTLVSGGLQGAATMVKGGTNIARG